MDFIRLFHKEETIAGISVSCEMAHALSFVKHAGTKGAYAIEAHGSVLVPEGTLEEGSLLNVRVMGERLRTLWTTARPMPIATPFMVASLPSSLFHFHTFRFSGDVSRSQLESVMRTQMGFTLPLSTDVMYFDWEEAPPRAGGGREIFFVWARRSAIDPYLAAFRDASFIPIAIEPHYISVLRTLDLPRNEGVRVFSILQAQAVTTLVYDQGSIRFVRVTPWARHALSRSATTPEEARTPSAERIVAITSDEIRRTLLFYESDAGVPATTPATFTLLPLFTLPNLVNAIASELAMEHTPVRGAIALGTLEGVTDEHRMQPIFGAGMRAMTPRNVDTMVSVMPVGTEALYQRTKALAFTRFVHDFLTTFSLYFAVLFCVMAVGFFYFINQEQMHAEGRNNFTLPQQVGQWERDATTLNTAIETLEKIRAEQPAWSSAIRTMVRLLTPGVTVTSFVADRTATTITLAGEADDLQTLLKLKKNLEASALFDRIDLPLSVFSQEGAVTFALPLVVKKYSAFIHPTP